MIGTGACLSAQSVAQRAAKLVQVSYQRSHELGKPVLTIADAVRANSFHDPPGTLLTTLEQPIHLAQCQPHHLRILRIPPHAAPAHLRLPFTSLPSAMVVWIHIIGSESGRHSTPFEADRKPCASSAAPQRG